ncbi:antitoxin Xre/MbcA/ParS toxin-binding domain-containing protein [Sagittula sp. S175]|uniref:antitoxin Xre/MbcA/ParS toxin-binding domain-containing protein n=1 Tax=Sagittula sp. S175 TaxID=3415129 RepID=UPI003C7ABE1F
MIPARLDSPFVAHPDGAERTRLSGPGLRSFRAIADLWGLTEAQRIAVLGEPPRSTYHAWMKKARAGEALTLPHDTLLRISAILGIHKALSILFNDPAQALAWLTGPHRGTVFRGASPLTFITEGAQDGMMTVRRTLDGWRGGHIGHGAAEGSFTPVTEDDVVFL